MRPFRLFRGRPHAAFQIDSPSVSLYTGIPRPVLIPYTKPDGTWGQLAENHGGHELSTSTRLSFWVLGHSAYKRDEFRQFVFDRGMIPFVRPTSSFGPGGIWVGLCIENATGITLRT